MAAMILGATFFNAVARDGQAAPGPHAGRPRPSWLSAMTASSNLLGAAVLLAGLSLALTVFVSSEIGILCSFLVFEVCNGIYVPCIAYQRGVVVNEANRAGLYGLMKVPLFAFVIAALLTSVEGTSPPPPSLPFSLHGWLASSWRDDLAAVLTPICRPESPQDGFYCMPHCPLNGLAGEPDRVERT